MVYKHAQMRSQAMRTKCASVTCPRHFACVAPVVCLLALHLLVYVTFFRQRYKIPWRNGETYIMYRSPPMMRQSRTGSRAHLATYVPRCSSNHLLQNHWESMEIFSRTLSLRIMIPMFGLNLTERCVVGLVERNQQNPWCSAAENWLKVTWYDYFTNVLLWNNIYYYFSNILLWNNKYDYSTHILLWNNV